MLQIRPLLANLRLTRLKQTKQRDYHGIDTIFLEKWSKLSKPFVDIAEHLKTYPTVKTKIFAPIGEVRKRIEYKIDIYWLSDPYEKKKAEGLYQRIVIPQQEAVNFGALIVANGVAFQFWWTIIWEHRGHRTEFLFNFILAGGNGRKFDRKPPDKSSAKSFSSSVGRPSSLRSRGLVFRIRLNFFLDFI